MALYYQLPVYKDTYQLIMMVYEVTRLFPREYKFSLGQDMKRDAMEKYSIFADSRFFVNCE